MKKILIVEDDEFIGRTYVRLFNMSGYTVERVHDGVMALEMLNKTDLLPTVIILDINLPNMNGRELLKHIKQDAKLKGILVVILTNSFFKEESQEFLNLGADLFLVKIQVSNKELIRQINDLVERSNNKNNYK